MMRDAHETWITISVFSNEFESDSLLYAYYACGIAMHLVQHFSTNVLIVSRSKGRDNFMKNHVSTKRDIHIPMADRAMHVARHAVAIEFPRIFFSGFFVLIIWWSNVKTLYWTVDIVYDGWNLWVIWARSQWLAQRPPKKNETLKRSRFILFSIYSVGFVACG